MGVLGNKKKTTAATPAAPNQTIGGYTAATSGGAPVSSGGFIDDGSRRMPSLGSALASENMARLRQQLSSRSGRASTDLSGTRSYISNFLGATL
jgi:hypothetical protein